MFCHHGNFGNNKLHVCTKGRVEKKANYPHFVDKYLTPPPLSTSAEVNNIHNKECFLATFDAPPPSVRYPH